MCNKIKIERSYKNCDCGRQHELEFKKKCSLADFHVGPCLFNQIVEGTKSPHNSNVNDILTIMFIFYRTSNINRVRIISNSKMDTNQAALQLFMRNWLKEITDLVKMKEVRQAKYHIKTIDVKLTPTYLILFNPLYKFYSKIWNYEHGLNVKDLTNDLIINHNMRNLYLRRNFSHLKQIDDDDLNYDDYISDTESISGQNDDGFLNVCSEPVMNEQLIISEIILEYINKLHPLRYKLDFTLNIDITGPWVYVNHIN